MPPDVRRRFERYASAELTWHPVDGGRRPMVCWDDVAEYVLSETATQSDFDALCERALSGRYYPRDAIVCYGPWQEEDRTIRAGDRMLQCAPGIPAIGWPPLWSMVEIFVAERTASKCRLGYVTTTRHFGRGIWQATLTLEGSRISLRIEGTAGPGSATFWLGLPIARYLQRRAWRRAVEDMRQQLAP